MVRRNNYSIATVRRHMTPSKRATNAARSVLRNPVNSKKAKQAAGLALTQRYMDVGVGT